MWVKPKSHTRANQRKRAKFAHRTSEAGSSARHVQPSLRSAARRSLDGVRGRRPSTTPGRHVLLLPVLEAQVQGRAARRSARAASTRARQCWSPGTAIGILQRRQCRRAGCGWREAVHGRRFFVRETWNRVSRLGGDESDDEPHSGAAAHEWHGDRRAAARRAWATAARTNEARARRTSQLSLACLHDALAMLEEYGLSRDRLLAGSPRRGLGAVAGSSCRGTTLRPATALLPVHSPTPHVRA